MLARRKTRIRAGGSCICAPSRWKSLPLRASKPRVFTPASGGDPVFGLPLTLRPEYSGVYVRTYILFEHPNAADKFKQTKKGNRPALTSLNETRFLSYKPGGCGWAHAGSRDTKRRHANAWRPGRPWQSQNQGDDDLSTKRIRSTFKQLASWPYASGIAPSIWKPFQEGSPV